MFLVIAIFNNLALGLTAFVVLYVNHKFLPRPLRPGWLATCGTAFCGLFYLALASLVFISTQWPQIRAFISN